MNHVELLIIGSGPIGLCCGIAAQEEGISYKILEKGCLVNSIYNFPEEMTFFSSANNLEIGNLPFNTLSRRPTKQEALEYYRRVVEHFNLKIGLYETFMSVQYANDTLKNKFQVITSKELYSCNFIINATGFYDTPVLINVSGEELPKVKHYYSSAHHLFRQKVAVIGASNSAIDVALEVARKGAEISLIIRGKAISDTVKYWIRPDVENRIAEGKITVYYEADIVEITNHQVVFKQKNKTISIENDFVYAMTGYQPNTKLLDKLQVKIDSSTKAPHHNPITMESNTPGIYLAGVVCVGKNTQELFIENTREHGTQIISHIKQQL